MTKYIYLFFRRISKDFKQKELLPVKFLFFIQMSTILVLYPYLTIHMRELGINVEETAIMSAVTPVVGILMPPVAGMLADKIGNFRILLAAFSVLGGLSALLLLLVPVGRIRITYPEIVILRMDCSFNKPLQFQVSQEYPCESKNIAEANVTIQSCGFICQDYGIVNNIHTKNYTVHTTDENTSHSFDYVLKEDDIYIPKTLSKKTNHEKLKNNEFYSTTIRKMSENSYFFPTGDVFNLNCNSNNINKNFQYNVSSEEFHINVDTDYQCRFMRNTALFQKDLKTQISGLYLNDSDMVEQQKVYNIDYIDYNLEKYSPMCLHGFGSGTENITVEIYSNDSETFMLDNCKPNCIATSRRKNFCSNDNVVIEMDIDLTFWSYLAVRVFIGIVGGTTYTMFEGAVIAILREYKADYGLQRMYASFGGMISSPFSGWMIDFASRGKGYTDFRPVFFLYCILKIISGVLMLFINLEFKSPASSVVSDVLAVLNVELFSLFVASFLLGSAWGYIESFLFWLIQDLGGSKSLMGLTITVGGIVGIPLLVLSGPFIKRVGHANVIFIGFLAYGIRLMGYSIIYNPWLSLIFEAMECLTHSLCFTAAVTYAARLSTVTTDTTIQGIFGGLFYGVGKSAGSLVGGYLIKLVGMRTTFQLFALMTTITGILYVIFYHCYMKKYSVLTMTVKEEPKKPPQGFEDIDLTKDANAASTEEIVEKIKSVPYEDTLTNLAYEDNEFDAECVEKEDESGKKNVNLNDLENQNGPNKI